MGGLAPWEARAYAQTDHGQAFWQTLENPTLAQLAEWPESWQTFHEAGWHEQARRADEERRQARN